MTETRIDSTTEICLMRPQQVLLAIKAQWIWHVHQDKKGDGYNANSLIRLSTIAEILFTWRTWACDLQKDMVTWKYVPINIVMCSFHEFCCQFILLLGSSHPNESMQHNAVEIWLGEGTFPGSLSVVFQRKTKRKIFKIHTNQYP